jgi:hypothetical protein
MSRGQRVIDTLLLLFAAFGSVDVVVAVAVLTNVPEPGTTVIVNVSLRPEARLAAVQVTVPPLKAQPVEADENVSPVGSVSVTVIPLAALGPAFETVIA